MKEVSQNMCKGFKQVQTHLYWFDNDNKTGLERGYRGSANKYNQPDNKHKSLERKNMQNPL